MTNEQKSASGGRVAPAGDCGEAPPMPCSAIDCCLGVAVGAVMVLLDEGWIEVLGVACIAFWCFTRGHAMGWSERHKKGSTK